LHFIIRKIIVSFRRACENETQNEDPRKSFGTLFRTGPNAILVRKRRKGDPRGLFGMCPDKSSERIAHLVSRLVLVWMSFRHNSLFGFQSVPVGAEIKKNANYCFQWEKWIWLKSNRVLELPK
jgi:hypothetical protein